MKTILACIALPLVTAVCLSEQGVETDRDSNFDFSRVQTFAVEVGTSWGDASSEAAAKQAITKRLEEKGWREADPSSSDALVILHGATRGKQTLRAFYPGSPSLGWYYIGAPALAGNDNYEYKQGTLVVDIFDTKTRKAVFRGVSPALTGNAQNVDQKIDKIAKQMFKSLPSNKTGS